MIREDTAKLEEIQSKYEEVKNTEVVNSYNIMENSPLSISVVEARELKSSTQSPYVMITVGESQKSQTSTADGTIDPVWNEVQNFDIVTGEEKILI